MVRVDLDKVALPGELQVPKGAGLIAVFAHGSGSSRLSPRNNCIADILRQGGIGTFLIDLLPSSPAAEKSS